MTKIVYGIGFNENRFPYIINRRQIKEYGAWQNMLLRCTESYWVKHPTYNGCTVSENFKSFTFFYEWYRTQTGSENEDRNKRNWHLDKDLLCVGNKVYSEDTCVFVPQRINKLLTTTGASRGKFPIGVSFNKKDKKFVSRCGTGDGGYAKYLGSYDTPYEAFLVYKVYKEDYIKQIANEYKDQLDTRAYQALMNYEVNIND